MTAKLATVEDRVAAGVEEARAVRDGGIVPRGARDKQLVGGMQFDCGYLSPYFVTDPERMEVAFENVHIRIHEKTIVLRRTCSRCLSRSQRVASCCS